MRASVFAGLSVAVIATLSVAGCAATGQHPPGEHRSVGNDCVFFRTVYDFQALDDSHLVIWAPSKRDAYELQLSFPIAGLRSAWSLGFIDGTRDGMLCPYGRDAVFDHDGMPQRSTILSMRRLNGDDIAKLEEKYKVKLSRDTHRKQLPKTPDRENAK